MAVDSTSAEATNAKRAPVKEKRETHSWLIDQGKEKWREGSRNIWREGEGERDRKGYISCLGLQLTLVWT